MQRAIHSVAIQVAWDLGARISPMVDPVTKGLTTFQFRALRLIWSQKQATLMEIAKTLRRDKSQVTRLIDDLCDAGYVERVPNEADRRSKLLLLTEKGQEMFASVEAIEAKFAEKLVEGIDRADLETYFAVSDRLIENLKEID